MEKNNRKVFYQGIHKLLWISYFCCLYWNVRGGKRKQDAVYCFRKMQENMCLLYEGAGEVQHFIACNFHVRNMLLHGQSNTAVGRSLTTWILLLKAFLQNVVAFCNKTSCLALMGSLLREYNCLCLLSFCSDVWIAVGHQGFQLWICWWCSTVLHSQSFISLNSVHSMWVQQYLLLHTRGFCHQTKAWASCLVNGA